MPAPSHDLLRYLHECYRENGSRSGLWNFFGSAVSHRLFLDEQDFLASNPEAEDLRYLRPAAATTTAKQAALHRKEKDLVYASIFLLGWVERFESKPEPVCAPLFLCPARLDAGALSQGAHLGIDPGRLQLNHAVIEAFGGTDLLRELEKAIDLAGAGEGGVGEVRRRIAEAIPGCDTSALLGYPELISGETLREYFEAISMNADAPPILLPAAAVALVNKSTEMRGVLNELETMASPGSPLSPPVRVLLGETPTPSGSATSGRVPTTLSAAQERVIASARQHPLSLAIGPPGTGKSFTIAALAIETLSRGGSVLIASKMDHAVDVVGNKIEASIGLEGVVTRGGRSEYLRQLKKFIEDLLAGIHTADAPEKRVLRMALRDLRELDRRIDRWGARLARRLAQEVAWGELLAHPAPGFFTRWRQNRVKNRLSHLPPVWEVAEGLEGLIDRRHDETLNYLRDARREALAQYLRKDRESVQHFSRAIRARTGTRQADFFEKMGLRRLLGALPIWLVNLSDVQRMLPLEGEAFDLAIIDEASQCDIASALPLLQRARRAVITGDPKQLRHLSFLPRARQRAIAEQFGLDESQRERFDFREVSLLDLVSDSISDQERIAFLNEHFRSQPEIIAFSNREFYGSQLHLMTGHRRPAGISSPPLALHRIKGAHREKSGANPHEAEAVIAALAEVCESQVNWGEELVHSLGVLSPFRDQVDHLLARVARHPLAASLLERHQLLIGTAHSFQGEERDIMHLSLAIDDASPPASYRFLERPDVFNVSITRARLMNAVWCSFDPSRLQPSSLLSRYLTHVIATQSGADAGAPAPEREDRVRDLFAAEVVEVLLGAGAEVRLHHPVAGMEIDLIYTLHGVSRGVDLIGYPGSMTEAFPLERVRIFRRAGLPILPLPYSGWKCRRELCERWLLGQP